MPARLIIPSGTRFARLLVVAHHDRNRFGQDRYECLCDCGNTRVVLGYCLKSGNTKACGCLAKEIHQRRITSHGLSKTPEYQVWWAMKARCLKPRHPMYKHYGARGITVCEEWRDSFENFYRDVGPRPSALHSLDRVKNGGNYEPGNVRWTTVEIQNKNTRHNVWLTLNGETHCIADWTKILGFTHSLIGNRLKAGWPPEKALTTPPDLRLSRYGV